MKKRNAQAGFSLVELMVVVAIIGVLATIAVPNYMRFQAKAKQSSAKTELAGLYTAQKATFVEYASYESNLFAAGYVPDGFTGDGLSADITGSYPDNGSTRLYTVTIEAGQNVVRNAGAFNNQWPTCLPTGSNNNCNALADGGRAAITQNTFTASAVADLGDSNNLDIWTINHNRSLDNEQPGF